MIAWALFFLMVMVLIALILRGCGVRV